MAFMRPGCGTCTIPPTGGRREEVLTELDGRYWSFEVVKSFTGRVIGLYATDGSIRFANFRYEGGSMNDFPAQTEGWAGPPRFIVPPEPRRAVDGSLRYEGITYAAPIGYRPLQLDLWVPAGETAAVPLVVWIHGGAWLFGDRRYLPPTLRPDQLFDELLAAGFAVATIDYRLSLEAKFPAQLHDAKAAVRYLRTHADQLGLDPGRVGVWGSRPVATSRPWSG